MFVIVVLILVLCYLNALFYQHPGEFAIAADHPFNPHVYLKSALTPEEFDAVMRGGIVIQTGTSGAGGSKKHKSKSSRRRLAANKQAAQQQHLGGVVSVYLCVCFVCQIGPNTETIVSCYTLGIVFF